MDTITKELNLLILTFEHPPHPGGIGTYSYQIGLNLNKLGVRVITLATNGNASDYEIKKFDSKQPYRIIRYERSKYKIIDIYKRIIKSFQVVKLEKPDVILVCNYKSIYIAYIYKIIFRIPYIIMGHGSEFLMNSILKKKLYGIALKNASVYLANSNYTSNLMINNYNINKKSINVILLGADTKKYNPIYKNEAENLKVKYSIKNKTILLTVGRVYERKGQKLVIKALSKLKNEYPDLVYMIVGRGPKINEYKELSKELGIYDRIKFIGFVADQELPIYYQMADIFILAAKESCDGKVEGFGIVLSEANLMELPVIGTMGSGIEDAIEDGKNGFLMPQDDIDAIIEKIRYLMNNKALSIKMGKEARLIALEKYNWMKVAEKTLNVIQDNI